MRIKSALHELGTPGTQQTTIVPCLSTAEARDEGVSPSLLPSMQAPSGRCSLGTR